MNRVFPNFVRRFARGGAEVLFNISNDGWFGNSAARQQHLTIVRMRAAENRRWILRSTNDGITGTIDPGIGFPGCAHWWRRDVWG
jgi:apolipoprotein N-acyltransferase